MIRSIPLAVLVLAACSEPTIAPPRTAELRVLSGNAQATTAGYTLPDTIVVELRDHEGAPIPFAPIHASTTTLLGKVTLVDALTNANGTARLVWRLGLGVGEQQLQVSTGADVEVSPLAVTAEARSAALRALAGDEAVLCAIDMTGRLGCWRPLADPMHAPQWTPTDTPERFVALAVHRLLGGERRGCAAATTGRVWCFDVADDAIVRNLAELPGAHPSVVTVSTGRDDLASDPPFCGLTTDGSAVCWGGNTWGALGDGTETSRDVVAAVASVLKFTQLAVGSYHACASAVDGVGWCWGRNDFSQVGIAPSAIPASTPIRRSGLLRFESLVPVPGMATCGVVRDNGGVYCWGAKEATGIGIVNMNTVEEPSFSFPGFAVGSGRGNMLAAVDRSAVVLGTDGESAWWGRLEPGVEQVQAYSPRLFVHRVPLATLSTGHHGNLLCGTVAGSNAYLCGRMMTLTGYPSHQLHPEFAGFGMPQP